MADILTANPLVIDLNATASRVLVPFPTPVAIRAIQVDGRPNAAADGTIELRQRDAVTGPHVWQLTVKLGADPVHYFESFGPPGIPCEGLYLDVAAAWVSSGPDDAIMLIYLW